MGLFGPPDIAKLKAKRDIAGLVKALVHQKDRSLAVPAADALGEIRDPRAVALLIAALGDKDWKLRAAAAEALGKIGDPRAAQPLIAILVDSQWDVRSVANEALVRIGAGAVEPLVAALKDGGVLGASGVRAYAASALGQIGDPRAVDPLIAALKDETGGVRAFAASALGQIGDPRAVEPLIAALKGEGGWARKEAVEALGQIGDPRAVEPLVAALNGEAGSVRKGAAEALGRLGDPRAVEPLVAALADRDREVREAAAQALDGLAWSPDRSEAGAAYWATRGNWDKCVEIGAPAAAPLVTALDLSYDEATRHAAAGALVQIGGAQAVEALMPVFRHVARYDRVEETNTSWNMDDGKTPMHLLAAETLVRIGTPAVEPLIAALKDPDKRVSEAAASALRRLGVPSSQWLTALPPPAGQAEPALGTEANEPAYLRGEDAGAGQPAATAGSAVQEHGGKMREACGTCGSPIDHFGFTQGDAAQVLAWRGQPGGDERRQALMRSVGGTCPGCAGVCCSKCYHDQKFTCPGCQSKIPELGGG